jgi:beta-lactamase class C
MTHLTLLRLALPFAAVLLCTAAQAQPASPPPEPALRAAIDGAIKPLMAANDIPGMAVAISIDGRTHVFPYGLASRADKRPVDDRTLFEIGSVSKVFTGTLGAWLAAKGDIALSDPAQGHWPALAGSPIGQATLLDLATYAAGGLPLQIPETVRDDAQLLAYFRHWQPEFPAGTQRLYSNPSIGLFGHLAARGGNASFGTLMTQSLLPALGLHDTFLQVPEKEMGRYAHGIAKDDPRVRVSPGALDTETYGIKTTAGDLMRLLELSMDARPLAPALQQAVGMAQTGYYRYGGTMQGLGWEIYDAPVTRDKVLAGNTTATALEPQAIARIDPPRAPQPDRYVNKTGSTRGFGAYAAFLPSQRIGVVLLANRNYPIPQRIEAAWRILEAIQASRAALTPPARTR